MCEMKNDKRQTAVTIMALVGGTCWGFSGCCGQYLFCLLYTSDGKYIIPKVIGTPRIFIGRISLPVNGFQ